MTPWRETFQQDHAHNMISEKLTVFKGSTYQMKWRSQVLEAFSKNWWRLGRMEGVMIKEAYKQSNWINLISKRLKVSWRSKCIEEAISSHRSLIWNILEEFEGVEENWRSLAKFKSLSQK